MNGHWVYKACLGLAWLAVVGIQGAHAEDNAVDVLSDQQWCEDELGGTWFEDENGMTACCWYDGCSVCDASGFCWNVCFTQLCKETCDGTGWCEFVGPDDDVSTSGLPGQETFPDDPVVAQEPVATDDGLPGQETFPDDPAVAQEPVVTDQGLQQEPVLGAVLVAYSAIAPNSATAPNWAIAPNNVASWDGDFSQECTADRDGDGYGEGSYEDLGDGLQSCCWDGWACLTCDDQGLCAVDCLDGDCTRAPEGQDYPVAYFQSLTYGLGVRNGSEFLMLAPADEGVEEQADLGSDGAQDEQADEQVPDGETQEAPDPADSDLEPVESDDEFDGESGPAVIPTADAGAIEEATVATEDEGEFTFSADGRSSSVGALCGLGGIWTLPLLGIGLVGLTGRSRQRGTGRCRQ